MEEASPKVAEKYRKLNTDRSYQSIKRVGNTEEEAL
jgi:hypothetical protein